MRAEPFQDAELSRDSFLGGRVSLFQPRDGYRAGVDPVFLAAAVPARAGQSVLELGCGAAPALCCLGRRVPDLALTGLELQPAYAALGRRNLDCNGLSGSIEDGDVAAPPPSLRRRAFDHVLMNPPYFEAGSRAPAPDPGRELALAGPTPLADWVGTAARRLRPRGTLTVILRAERLPELLASIVGDLGAPEVFPLWPRAGRPPRLILLRARKQGRAAFRLHPGLILHAPETHEADGDDYGPAASAVLRDGAALHFPA